MMRTFLSVCRKEILLLLRDIAGLTMLFVMPVALIVISSLMQESGWGELTKDPTIPVLFVDNDKDSLAADILEGFRGSGSFEVTDSLNGRPVNDSMARTAVMNGVFQIAVIIPAGATEDLRRQVRLAVAKTLAGFGMGNAALLNSIRVNDSLTVTILFDPSVKRAFRQAMVSTVKEQYYRFQTTWIFASFNREMANQMPMYTPPEETFRDMLGFREEFPSFREKEVIPNSTQHNVPAWAIFAMFFIVIPLTQSLIQEREGGSLLRLLSMPVNYMTFVMGKVAVYFTVCLFQTAAMLLAGMLLLPLLGLPMLDPGNNYFSLTIMTITVALAAVGYGMMIGTLARTHQQAAAFGSISVIILSAMGGLWVPIYLMPPFMKTVSQISPLNWSITGFYDIFLRGGGLAQIGPEIARLVGFFLVTVVISAVYRKYKNPINN